eukprot:5729695-Prymnesium_polylepis.1
MLLDAWFAEEQEATNGWSPSQSIENAAAVLAFEVIWRNAVSKDSKLSLKHDCHTRETILDTYTSAATCIYRFRLYHEHFPNHKPYGAD